LPAPQYEALKNLLLGDQFFQRIKGDIVSSIKCLNAERGGMHTLIDELPENVIYHTIKLRPDFGHTRWF